MRKMVIYRSEPDWTGAAEVTVGRWPFKKIQHAPVTHADTPEEVFAWLLLRYPDDVISYDPAVTRRYRESE